MLIRQRGAAEDDSAALLTFKKFSLKRRGFLVTKKLVLQYFAEILELFYKLRLQYVL